MTKRATNGKTITRKARRSALLPEKPLFFGYNPSTATNYAENALQSEENGPYGQVFAISTMFFRTTNLTGPKTAKILNNGVLGTRHKVSSPQTPDVGIIYTAYK